MKRSHLLTIALAGLVTNLALRGGANAGEGDRAGAPEEPAGTDTPPYLVVTSSPTGEDFSAKPFWSAKGLDKPWAEGTTGEVLTALGDRELALAKRKGDLDPGIVEAAAAEAERTALKIPDDVDPADIPGVETKEEVPAITLDSLELGDARPVDCLTPKGLSARVIVPASVADAIAREDAAKDEDPKPGLCAEVLKRGAAEFPKLYEREIAEGGPVPDPSRATCATVCTGESSCEQPCSLRGAPTTCGAFAASSAPVAWAEASKVDTTKELSDEEVTPALRGASIALKNFCNMGIVTLRARPILATLDKIISGGGSTAPAISPTCGHTTESCSTWDGKPGYWYYGNSYSGSQSGGGTGADRYLYQISSTSNSVTFFQPPKSWLGPSQPWPVPYGVWGSFWNKPSWYNLSMGSTVTSWPTPGNPYITFSMPASLSVASASRQCRPWNEPIYVYLHGKRPSTRYNRTQYWGGTALETVRSTPGRAFFIEYDSFHMMTSSTVNDAKDGFNKLCGLEECSGKKRPCHLIGHSMGALMLSKVTSETSNANKWNVMSVTTEQGAHGGSNLAALSSAIQVYISPISAVFWLIGGSAQQHWNEFLDAINASPSDFNLMKPTARAAFDHDFTLGLPYTNVSTKKALITPLATQDCGAISCNVCVWFPWPIGTQCTTLHGWQCISQFASCGLSNIPKVAANVVINGLNGAVDGFHGGPANDLVVAADSTASYRLPGGSFSTEIPNGGRWTNHRTFKSYDSSVSGLGILGISHMGGGRPSVMAGPLPGAYTSASSQSYWGFTYNMGKR